MIENVRPVPPSAPARASRADARCDLRLSARARRAFSLLELVIVMVIAGVLATMAILRYSGSLTRYRLDGASRRIIAELARAQVEARTTGSPRTIRFSSVANSYAVLTADDLLNSRTGSVVKLGEDPYRATVQVNGLAGNAVTFNTYGDPSGGGIVTLTTGDQTTAVVIDPNSGRAYVSGTP